MIRKLLASFAAMALVLVGLVAISVPATAGVDDVCPGSVGAPDAEGWVKTDYAGDAITRTATPPAGYEFAGGEICYKSGDERVFTSIYTVNGDGSVTVTSAVYNKPEGEAGRNLQDISHVSIKVRLIPVVPEVASAAIWITEASCDVGETLNYGAISNATFSGTPNGTVGGPTAYSVTATADEGAEFPGGKTTEVFTGTLAGPDTALCPVVREQFVTVLWQMDKLPATASAIGWPQTYVNHVVTSTPTLGAFDAQLVGECVGFQVDVYKYTEASDQAKVDALIAGKVLYGPNNPPEPLIPGGAGTAWKTYVNLDCPEPSVEFSHEAVCGEASVTVTSEGIPAAWWYGATVSLSSAPGWEGYAIKQGPGTATKEIDLAEDEGGGLVTVKYWVHAATEWDLVPADLLVARPYAENIGSEYRTFTVDTDCEANTLPEVSVMPGQCIPFDEEGGYLYDENGSITVTGGTHVDSVVIRSMADGNEVADASDLPPGEYKVIVHVTQPLSFTNDEGWTVLNQGLKYTKVVTIPETSDCLIEVVPVKPTVLGQQCVVDDDGQSFIGGSVAFADTNGITYSIEGNVLTGLEPGDYKVTATVNEDGFVFDDTSGWNMGEDPNVLTTTITIEKADDCLSEQELLVTPEPTATDPSCTADGTLVYKAGDGYSWNGPDYSEDGETVTLTAVALPGFVIPGESTWEFKVADLKKLPADHELCLAKAPVVPTVVKTATLAETGFPLLGLLGLASSFALIGGGLANARRLLRKGD